jgi:hypothetical protein
VRLLVADLLRRKRRTAIYVVIVVAATWWMTAEFSQGPSRAIGASMAMAFLFGPLFMGLVPRPIWYLPVSRREIWRASWLVATVAATLVTTGAKLIAMLVPVVRESFGPSALLLSSACDFAYTGIGCALAIVASRPLPMSGPWRPFAHAGKAVAEAAPVFGPIGALLLGGLYGGFEWPAAGPLLPGHWGDLTPRHGAVLAAALSLALATWFHVPVPPTPAARVATRTRDRSRTRRLEPRGTAGLRRLLAHEYAWTMVCTAVLVGGSVVVVAILASLPYSGAGVTGFVRTALLVFGQTIPPPPAGGHQAVIVLILFACFGASIVARFPAMIRHLRVLPLGSLRLGLLLLGWPWLLWLSIWMAWLVLHLSFVGEGPTSLRPASFAALAGMSALVQGIGLRFTGRSHAFGVGASLVIVPIMLFVEPLPAASLVIAGMSALAAAALNHVALRRNDTYRGHHPFEIGLSVPPR